MLRLDCAVTPWTDGTQLVGRRARLTHSIIGNPGDTRSIRPRDSSDLRIGLRRGDERDQLRAARQFNSSND